MRARRGIPFAVVLTLLVGMLRAADAADSSADRAVSDARAGVYGRALADYGIAATRDALAQFLRGLGETSAGQSQVQQWIAALGDEQFAVRERAMRQLLALPRIPEQQLQQATTGADPEIRWRAVQILRRAGSQHAALLYAVLKSVEYTPVRSLTKELLLALPRLQSPVERRAALAALEATIDADDRPLVARALRSKSARIRAAGLQLAGRLEGAHARRELLQALGASEPEVQLAAARELARLGDAKCLTTLVALLDADDLELRVESQRILSQVTEAHIAFAGYDPPAMRRPGLAAWQEWLRSVPSSGTLSRSLDRWQPRDLTLICQPARDRVIELDAAGREVWSTTAVARPWYCRGLPDGHRLIAAFDGRELVEFDAAGVELWRAGPLPGNISGLDRLSSGGVLVTLPELQRIVEVDRQGQISAGLNVAGLPRDARRLSTGRTLVALTAQNRLVELDANGREVWNLPGVASPLAAERLANGHTLVVEGAARRVIEVTAQGRVVWTRTVNPSPHFAQRLENGNTLIGHSLGAAEVSANGKIVWRIDGEPLGGVCRY